MRLECVLARVCHAPPSNPNPKLLSAKYLSENRWLTFVDDRFLHQLGPNDGRSRDQLRLAWIGQCLSLWEALRAHRASLPWQDASQIPALRAEIQRGFPRAIARDTHADWSRWPGDRTLIETIPMYE